MLVNIDQIIVSDRFNHSDAGFKYFIGHKEGRIVEPLCIILPQMSGHQEGRIVEPLCIILPQMSGYIKHFENGGKNMSFLIKYDEVWEKYDKIWEVIKDKLNFIANLFININT